jgi:CubicO group peptidase (beta-lactamase class C family)
MMRVARSAAPAGRAWRGPAALLALTSLSTAPMLHAQLSERAIDSLMARYAQPGGPGASLLVVRDGRTVLARGYGLADVERRVPVTPETNFRLASLSKQFTATAIMLLVADGKLRYDDSISTLVAGLPAFARGVTVRHLLNHTSGLSAYEDFVPDSQTAQVHDADIPALISHANGLKFAPGTHYAYSNTGYVLLALVVEHVTGKPFADVLRERIFAPLGMTNTMAREERTVVPHRAYGYTLRPAGVRLTDQSNTSATLGDGGIYSNILDLAKWDRALTEHTLVGADAQRLAWTPPTLPDTAVTEYGFGWFIGKAHGTTRQWHHGESRGFTNFILRYPDRRLTVVILTNRTGGAPWDTADQVASLVEGW